MVFIDIQLFTHSIEVTLRCHAAEYVITAINDVYRHHRFCILNESNRPQMDNCNKTNGR